MSSRIRVNAGAILLTIVLTGVSSGQTVSTVVDGAIGDGSAGTSASLKGPFGVYVDEAEDIFVAGTGNDQIRKIAQSPSAEVVSVTLGGQQLLEGEKNPPVAAGDQMLEITFSVTGVATLDGDGDVEFPDAGFLVIPLEGIWPIVFTMAEDPKTIQATLSLQANATYQLYFVFEEKLVSDPTLPVVYNYHFGTSELPDATVSGTVSLPEKFANARLDRDESFAALLNRNPLEILGEGEDALAAALVRTAPIGDDFSYSLKYVPDGTYYLGAGGEAIINGEDTGFLIFYDADGDGNYDPVVITGGMGVAGLDISVPKLTCDFDANGVVNFDDFLLFATSFGSRRGDSRYGSVYDLDGDDRIDFDDFLTFAGQFGKRSATRPAVRTDLRLEMGK